MSHRKRIDRKKPSQKAQKNYLSLTFIAAGFVLFFAGFITLVMIAFNASLSVGMVCAYGSPMLMGLMFVVLGIKVTREDMNTKVKLLSSAVNVMGFIEILCTAVIGAGQCFEVDLNTGLSTILIGVFAGIFVVWLGIKVNDEPNPRDRMTYLLIFIFTILIVAYAITMLALIGTVGLFDFIGRMVICIFVLSLLINPEVKSRFMPA